MTKGRATSVCANGTSKGDVIHAPYEMINPRPSMTADEPIGSIIRGSRIFTTRVGFASASAAGKPRRRESTTVAPAYLIELIVAWIGGTKNTEPRRLTKSSL